ncbi:uncharacterized protein SCODWIG_00818 [Saccharomycodes ludwigii]|uniref:Fe2OG dioxygenase domain-containing protein n=1 Tax=Saccharomycodes ludwigii TaxID=36035 RepID=A0A376B301_9ASCO|nr:uncharacterized protein SCODWIG_00818 [Saccharomycodes ludwigii]
MGKKKLKVSKSANAIATQKSPSVGYRFPDELSQLPIKSPILTYNKKPFDYVPYPEVTFENKLILIPNFINKDLCSKLINSLQGQNEKSSSSENKCNDEFIQVFHQKGTKDYAERFNGRFEIFDETVADELWKYLRGILFTNEYIIEGLNFRLAKGLNPHLRYYRYTKGHYFGKHYDDSVKITTFRNGNNKINGETKWTLLIYLSGGDQLLGGDTVFYSSMSRHVMEKVHPLPGLALLHKHGDDCLLHEAELVKNGVKWVLRSDVYF